MPSRLTSCLIIWLSFFASSTALAPRFVSNIFPTAAAPAAPVDEGRRSLIRSVGTAFLVALPAAAEADSSPLQELAAIGGWVDSGGKTKSGKEQVLNEDGEYVDANRGGDSGWQDTWKSRLDKASSMSADEILMAARGAGNVEQRVGEESAASQKRRAMAGCKVDGLRAKAGAPDEKQCVARVLKGDSGFMLDVLDAGRPPASAPAPIDALPPPPPPPPSPGAALEAAAEKVAATPSVEEASSSPASGDTAAAPTP